MYTTEGKGMNTLDVHTDRQANMIKDKIKFKI